MMIKRVHAALLPVLAIVALLLLATFSAIAHPHLATARPVESTTVLYDGMQGGTPDQQGMAFETIGPVMQSFDGAATTLDSTAIGAIYGGYSVTPTLMPALKRADGFRLSFTVQVMSETHSNVNRSGLSVILLAEDLQGIELGFWEDKILAQEGGATQLFTFAESVDYDTTTGLINYDLEIADDSYALSVADTIVLSGTVRDYTAWTPPSGVPNPYQQPNMVYVGDNSSGGMAKVRLAYVAIVTETAVSPTPTATPKYRIMLPSITSQ